MLSHYSCAGCGGHRDEISAISGWSVLQAVSLCVDSIRLVTVVVSSVVTLVSSVFSTVVSAGKSDHCFGQFHINTT